MAEPNNNEAIPPAGGTCIYECQNGTYVRIQDNSKKPNYWCPETAGPCEGSDQITIPAVLIPPDDDGE